MVVFVAAKFGCALYQFVIYMNQLFVIFITEATEPVFIKITFHMPYSLY